MVYFYSMDVIRDNDGIKRIRMRIYKVIEEVDINRCGVKKIRTLRRINKK